VDWARPIVVGLIAAVIVSVLAAVGGKAQPDKKGWRLVAPSAMHWTGILLGGGLVLLMGYVRLFVGSSRPDSDTQMTILTWLILAFALCTIVTGWSMVRIRRQAIRWRGTRLVYNLRREEREVDLSTISETSNDLIGGAVVHFADGTVLRLDPYARGARELLEALSRKNDDDPL
jgi:small-conductance mechanosensitive channel